MAYLTLAEVKAALAITGSDDDLVLSRSISLVASLINGYLGYDPTNTALVYTYTTVIDHSARMLQLPIYPVRFVDLVTANGEVVPGGDDNYPYGGWWLNSTHGIIEELDTVGGSGRYGSRVTVLYRAGYDPVPQELKDIALNLIGSVFANGGDIKSSASGGTGELKSLTMFDAMSMSFDTGGSTSSEDSSGPEALVGMWAFVLDKYRISGRPVLA